MRRLAPVIASALAAAALVACGGDGGGGGYGAASETGAAAGGSATAETGAARKQAGAVETLKLEADPGGELAFTTDAETARAGQVRIELSNPQTVPHDVSIETEDGRQVGRTDVVTDGSATTTVKLKPGRYTFYCSVPGHRAAGMEGTLRVG